MLFNKLLRKISKMVDNCRTVINQIDEVMISHWVKRFGYY